MSNPMFEKENLLKDISSEMDMSKKVRLAISFLQTFKPPFQDSLNVLKQFEHSEETLQVENPRGPDLWIVWGFGNNGASFEWPSQTL